MARRLFVVSGPSGVGKSTILRRVVAADPAIRFAVSHTTRPMRQGEVDGRDYHFVDEREFERLVEADAFVEHATVHGHRYGTSRHAIAPDGSGDLLIEVDVQGADALRGLSGVVTIFIAPPTIGDLAARLERRQRDTSDAIRGRLRAAPDEMRQQDRYDEVVVNRDVGEAVAALTRILSTRRVG